MIRVLVSGAAGRMGREVVKAVVADHETLLVAAVDRHLVGRDAGETAGIENQGIALSDNLKASLEASGADVAVDFSTPDAAVANIESMLEAAVAPVVGTTGISQAAMDSIDQKSRQLGVPVLIAPNFAIGAVLMMRFAGECSRLFSYAEIIEYHHEQKVDAPSGTALKTARVMREGRASDFQHVGGDGAASAAPGSRGGQYGGVAIHSVRLPGYLAHQEVIFGSPGQTLSIRHDTITRECYMPGVLLAIKKVRERQGLTFGLEHIL